MSQTVLAATPENDLQDDRLDVSDYSGMSENSPINILYCDQNFKIAYVNPSSLTTFKNLEQHLPLSVSQILGSSLDDLFERSPAYQLEIRPSKQKLPLRATIEVGPERLDLLLSAMSDKSGVEIGTMVTWEVVTKKLEIENSAAQKSSMVEGAPINIMYANTEGVITYLNPASKSTLEQLEQYLPVRIADIEGGSYDVFHKNPAHQRKILADEHNLPHRTQINVGPEVLDLLVSATYDAQGSYTGPMVTWEVITQKLELEASSAQKSSMIDGSPNNIIFADLNTIIQYLNPRSYETLKTVEQYLPIQVSEISGSSFDVFHKNPNHQRKIIADANNLPHRAVIDVGPEKLDLLVSAVHDNEGQYTGVMLTWDVVTKKLAQENEVSRMSSMIENAPTNMMFADNNGVIKYMNPKSLETLGSVEQYLPVKAKEIVGSSYDIFHKNPDHQRKLLADPNNLPHQTLIKVGPETLDLAANATYDAKGNYIGPTVTWSVVTQKIKYEAEMAQSNAVIENAPINLMFADRDGIIKYMNPASEKTLLSIEQYLPKKASQVVGESYDDFHKDPSHQRGLLKDPKNLPHSTKIQIGPEVASLEASAIYDQNGEYMGPMISWAIITEDERNKQKMAEVNSLVQNANVNLLYADKDLFLRYMNPASEKALMSLQEHLPDKVSNLVGQSIDIFHKNPAHNRQIASNERNLPHKAEIHLGNEILALEVMACYDDNHNFIGPMAVWDIITQKKHMISKLAEAASALAASSEELTATAGEMSNNAGTTQKEANQANDATNTVSSSVQQVASSAGEMHSSILEISQAMNKTSSMVNKTMTDASETNEIMTKLATSSQEIGDVIKVINSIAQQTNLLALNATIEAARAGDAGRGFAVVANEVKELANQTATATDEITKKINAIQSDTSNSVEAIKGISESISQVNSIATQISAAVEEQNATTNELTNIAARASEGVNSVASNIGVVSNTADQTAEGANQLVTAASGLQQLAQELSKLVEQVENEDK